MSDVALQLGLTLGVNGPVSEEPCTFAAESGTFQLNEAMYRLIRLLQNTRCRDESSVSLEIT